MSVRHHTDERTIGRRNKQIDRKTPIKHRPTSLLSSAFRPLSGEILLEERDRTLPGQFGRVLVVARRRALRGSLRRNTCAHFFDDMLVETGLVGRLR
jgi:hypothetical protein